MPSLTSGTLKIDYAVEGHGEAVILIHGSVSANRQWRALSEALREHYRVLAINLYGYGDTTVWPGTSSQTLGAQAQLVLALCEEVAGRVHLIGHSFGGSVALKAAKLVGPRLGSLVLLEPNPFYLLKQAGRIEAYLEAQALRDHVRCFGSLGQWTSVAERFADYWLGDGSWSIMPEKRRASFMESLRPNIHEWDAVMEDETTIDEWRSLATRTLLVSDRTTRRPIREIVELLTEAYPWWSHVYIEEGGHMAPLTRPDLINPIVREFLDAAIAT